MFAQATNFNSNISNWDVSNVTTMYGMFQLVAERASPPNPKVPLRPLMAIRWTSADEAWMNNTKIIENTHPVIPITPHIPLPPSFLLTLLVRYVTQVAGPQSLMLDHCVLVAPPPSPAAGGLGRWGGGGGAPPTRMGPTSRTGAPAIWVT
jgi:surface protein